MQTFELLLIAVGLAMDAFAVSVCKGLSIRDIHIKTSSQVGLYFGLFQATMPLLGYFLGTTFSGLVTSVDHWIAFVLLGLIGLNMIKESREESSCDDGDTSFKTMLPLAIATSIDALAVGITFAFLDVNIWIAISLIGLVTFVLSFIGTRIGNVFGQRFKGKAEFAGGLILILMGIKILIEHLTQ